MKFRDKERDILVDSRLVFFEVYKSRFFRPFAYCHEMWRLSQDLSTITNTYLVLISGSEPTILPGSELPLVSLLFWAVYSLMPNVATIQTSG